MNETIRIAIIIVSLGLTALFGAQWFIATILNKQLQAKQAMMRLLTPRGSRFASAIKVLIPATVFLIAVSIAAPLQFENFNGVEIARIQSDADLRQLLSEYRQEGNFLMPGLAVTSEMRTEMAMPTAPGADSFTETNVQVIGVDEIDNVKTDGRFIYQMRYNYELNREEVVIIQAWPIQDVQTLLVLPVVNDFNCYENVTQEFCVSESIQGLYVDDDSLIVILSRSVYQNYAYEGRVVEEASDESFRILPWFGNWNSDTVVRQYSKADAFDLVDEFVFEGYMIGTRKINENLFVITSKFINVDADVLLPRFSHNDDVFQTEYANVNYLRDTNPNGFTSIYGINLTTKAIDDEHMLTSASSIIYVSPSNIYLLDQRFLSISRMAFIQDQGFNPEEAISRVSRFALDGHTVTLAAVGEFQGYPLNQFSMDERNGFLRVTTTEGWGDDTNNRLIVLNDNLTIVSTLQNLGKPRERIQSTRFVGDRAYLVTFEMTDPFYVIDVSNPLDPVILGELEITGFSSYLQPLDANHILGIGFEADDRGTTLGMKLAIYDVSDPSNPIERSQALLLYEEFGWNFASVTYNHKDLLLDTTRNIIGFPFQSFNYNNNEYTYQTGYMVYSFDDLTLTREAFIQHSDSADYMNSMQKGLFLEDYLFTVSSTEVGISALNDLTRLIRLVDTTQ
jgi:inhibitor of cysteine peptidase